MKKFLWLAVMVLPLVLGCNNNNKIIGTWVSTDSTPKDNVGVSSGKVSFLTFKPDGTFEDEIAFQIGVNNNAKSAFITTIGKWEMRDDNCLLMRTTALKIEDETRENDNDNITEYVISRLDDEVLEMMRGGQILKYRKK